MKRNPVFSLIIVLIFTFVMVSCARQEKKEQEKTVSEKEVPQAVLKAFNTAYPGATINEYSEETGNGQTCYEIACIFEGRRIDAVYNPDGSVSAIEEVVAAETLPEAVRQAIAREVPQYSLKLAEKIDKTGEILYEVKVLNTQDQKTYELQFSATGELLEKEMKKNEAEMPGEEEEEAEEANEMTAVPAAVTSAFEARFSGAADIEWGKESDDEFEAEFTLNGSAMSANFDAAGEWLETESKVAENELPAAVQSTLNSEFTLYKVLRAERLEKPGEPVTFEVKLEKNESATDVVLDEAGKVLKKEVKNEAEEEEGEQEND